MRPFFALIAIAFAGTAGTVWLLSGLLPRFLLPDLSFLAIVYAGLFFPGPLGFLAALLPAFFREVTIGAPPGSIFFASLGFYFLAREIGLRLFFRSEFLILAVVATLLAVESVSIQLLLLASGARSVSLLWGVQETIRIAWTSLIAVFLFMDLSSRWQRVRE
ncbi:MAG: hypothetical protein Kow00128_14230 [Deltaproteobacteria bacterium]